MIRYNDPKELNRRIKVKADPPEGWHPAAYGGLKAHHFTSQAHREKAVRVHQSERPSITESAFELQVELHILGELPGPEMVFVEVGAGWGAQTLTFHTAIRNQVVETDVKSLRAFAVEAEPGHYGFLVETWVQNQIPGVPIFGAMAETLDWGKFYAVHAPESNYGQSLHPRGNVTVPTFTLRNLLETFSLDEVDLVHMDIQGAEPRALQGARGVLERFRWLIVCPHYDEHVPVITEELRQTHEQIVCFGPRSGYHEVEGFSLPVHMPEDGITVWRRK